MKKRNLKELQLNKKSIAVFMSQINGGLADSSHKRTKSALPLCPGCPSIPGMDPTCDIMQDEQ